MLFFVRLHITIPNSAYNLKVVDWSLLCCRSSVAHKIHPDYSAQSARHIIYYPARIYQQLSLTQPNGSQPQAVRETHGLCNLYGSLLRVAAGTGAGGNFPTCRKPLPAGTGTRVSARFFLWHRVSPDLCDLTLRLRRRHKH